MPASATLPARPPYPHRTLAALLAGVLLQPVLPEGNLASAQALDRRVNFLKKKKLT